MLKIIGFALGWIMKLCFDLTGSYGVSIIIFTLITKILLFPTGILTQFNSIKMIRLMPEEFFISLGLKGLAAFLPLLALTAAAALRLRRKDGADGKRPGDRDGIRDRGKGKG